MEKSEVIYQALGEASMCWSETPHGVFDSARCKEIGERLLAALGIVEEKDSSPNRQSVQCLCGNPAVVHFCQSCLKTHDQYCNVPF